jgi:hypothetical protein
VREGGLEPHEDQRPLLWVSRLCNVLRGESRAAPGSSGLIRRGPARRGTDVLRPETSSIVVGNGPRWGREFSRHGLPLAKAARRSRGSCRSPGPRAACRSPGPRAAPGPPLAKAAARQGRCSPGPSLARAALAKGRRLARRRTQLDGNFQSVMNVPANGVRIAPTHCRSVSFVAVSIGYARARRICSAPGSSRDVVTMRPLSALSSRGQHREP